MAQQLGQTWEQELLARGEKRGEECGRVMAYRAMLQKQLQKRFPALPEELLQRIARADLPSLEAALDQVDSLQTPEDLRL